MRPGSSTRVRSSAPFSLFLGFLFLGVPILAQTAAASEVVIDFESYPWGEPTVVFDPVDTEFSSWGIAHFESVDLSGNIASPVIAQPPDYPLLFHSGISGLAPHPGAPIGSDPTIEWLYGFAQAPIYIYFSSEVEYFSVVAMDVGYNGLVVEAFDVDSYLIASVVIDGTGRYHDGPPGGDGFDFIEIDVPGIFEIAISQVHDAAWDREHGLGLEGYLLDDMTFIPVPEPSGVLPVGLALVGLLSRGHRRPLSKSAPDDPATDSRD